MAVGNIERRRYAMPTIHTMSNMCKLRGIGVINNTIHSALLALVCTFRCRFSFLRNSLFRCFFFCAIIRRRRSTYAFGTWYHWISISRLPQTATIALASLYFFVNTIQAKCKRNLYVQNPFVVCVCVVHTKLYTLAWGCFGSRLFCNVVYYHLQLAYTHTHTNISVLYPSNVFIINI